MKKNKILIIKLGAIGDVVHSSIIATAIKAKHKDCEIHFLTADFIAPLLENNPDIARVFSYSSKSKIGLFEIIFFSIRFLFERYDYIIPLSNTVKNFIMSYVAMPKAIIKRNKVRVHAVDAFFNTANDIFHDLEKPKNLKLYVNPNLKLKIEKQIQKYSRPYILLSPGGANDNARQGRIWVDENWIELGNKLIEKYGGTIFIAGSRQEEKAHEKYEKIKGAVIFSGKLSLEESATLFSLTDLFISGDSGPLHIASALNVNTIGLMGSTAPENCAPYGKKGYFIEPLIECRYCGEKICSKLQKNEKISPCMKSITVKKVIEFIIENKLL